MNGPTEETCDPSIESWVTSAGAADSDFPLQNLPLGVVRDRNAQQSWRIGTAIGDQVLDLSGCSEDDLLHLGADIRAALSQPTLNALMALGSAQVGLLRQRVHALLRDDAAEAVRSRVSRWLIDTGDVEHALPARIGNFTDFFSSIHHATNVVRLRNPDASLPSNFVHAPLGYHGRASSIAISGTPVVRPNGPRRGTGSGVVYAPTERLDFEVELGLFIGTGTALGTPVHVRAARSHLVGVCLLNDWSARDIQSFESQPLGPFLSKSFTTSISPWVVTTQALEPFRVRATGRPEFDAPLPHLFDEEDQARGAWTIVLETSLTSRTMRELEMAPALLSTSDARTLFWTPAQLVAHHTSNGCNLDPADVLGTGTVSGPEANSRACLLEITRGGREPLTLPTGETRAFLKDDDEVTLRAYCSAPGAKRIGFGECRGRVAPARRDL